MFNYYGMSVVAANSATNGALVMSGTTDSNGQAVFTMANALGYNVKVYYQGSVYTYALMPAASSTTFEFRLPATGITDSIIQDLYANGNTWTAATMPDPNHITFEWSYQDTSIYTTAINYYLQDTDNGTMIYHTGVSNPVVGGIYTLNYTVPNIRGQNYQFWENYTRSI